MEEVGCLTSAVSSYDAKNESDYFKSTLVCIKASSEAMTLITYLSNRSNIEIQ